MHMLKSSSELKAKARGVLLGKYSVVVPAFLLLQSIFIVVDFLSSTFTGNGPLGLVMNLLMLLIIQLLAGIFAMGEAHLYLNVSCEQPCHVQDIFYGFRTHPDRGIVAQFLILLRELLCMAPAVLLFLLYSTTQNPFVMLLFSISLVTGGAFAIIILLTYSQVFFLLVDFPAYSVLKVMNMSKQLTKGCRGRLFYIWVSFLPLLLLSLITCCVGFLWVIPYFHGTLTQFYLELVRVKTSVN